MKTNNWGNAFGEVPGVFAEKVRLTAARMQRAPRKVPQTRLALLAAAAAVLVAGTAFALSQLGVLDTLQETLRSHLQPGADTLVQAAIPQTAEPPRHATFTVEEAINDGRRMYAVVRVHGDSGVLLMDSDAEASWTADWWQGGTGADTYSKRAYDTGRTLVQASVYAVDADGNTLPSAPEIHYDGEDILYTLSFPAEGTDAVLLLDTFEVFADGKPQADRLSSGRLAFSIPATGARRVFTAQLPAGLPLGNLTLTALTVEQTPVATYLTCEYEAAAGAPDLTYVNLRDGIWVDWLDEAGQPYPWGENSNMLEQAADGHTRLTTVYRAFETLPESITLSFRNGMTGEAFDTVTLALHPITKEAN